MPELTAETIEFDTYDEYIEFLDSYRDYNYNYTQTINHKDYIAYYIKNEGKNIKDVTKDILDVILRCGVNNEYCEDYDVLILACIMNGANLEPFTKYIFVEPKNIEYDDIESLEENIDTRSAIINYCREFFDIDYILNYTNWDEVENVEGYYVFDKYMNDYNININNPEIHNKIVLEMYKKYISFKHLKETQAKKAAAAVMPAGGAGAAAPIRPVLNTNNANLPLLPPSPPNSNNNQGGGRRKMRRSKTKRGRRMRGKRRMTRRHRKY
jgi:hypothetical protein